MKVKKNSIYLILVDEKVGLQLSPFSHEAYRDLLQFALRTAELCENRFSSVEEMIVN